MTPSEDGFQVDWDYPHNDSNPEGWKVYYKPTGADDWIEPPLDLKDGDANSASVSLPGAKPGETYDVLLVPYAGDVESDDATPIKTTLSQ